MSDNLRCDNCGAIEAELFPCPCGRVPCPITTGICKPCVRTVHRNNARESRRAYDAAFANPRTRAWMEGSIARTKATDPSPDDPDWMRAER